MSNPKLFYAPGACSLAPHIALEETGQPFETVAIDMKNGEQLAPAYLAINPKGRVPTLAVEDWVLTENPAILQFIARAYPQGDLWPADLQGQASVGEWLAWIASTVHVAYAHVRRTQRYATSESALEDVRAKGVVSCREVWRTIDGRLNPGRWACGDRYTVADCYLMVFWTWGRGPALGFDMPTDYPNWTDHARRMAERPAVRRAFAREGLALPA